MINNQIQQELASSLFNKTWEYLDKATLTDDEQAAMINTAHASLYHWMQIGTPENKLVGEWQLSRVYSVLKMGERSLYHAKRSLHICQNEGIQGFNLAYAYEAMSRSSIVLNLVDDAKKYLSLAHEQVENINDKEERDLIDADLLQLDKLLTQ